MLKYNQNFLLGEEGRMNIAFVDDSLVDRQYLQKNVERYCFEHKVHMQMNTYDNGTGFLKGFAAGTYDLVLLDIFMDETSGIHIAEKVRQIDDKCLIIFTTSSQEHAVIAFRLHALDYLLKPFTYGQLEESLSRCQKAPKRFSHYIELKEGRHYTRILITDIIYTDYYNHYIQVHTPRNVIRSYMSFPDFAPMPDKYPQFLWCYRNCMVNMDYIKSMDSKDILATEERIPLHLYLLYQTAHPMDDDYPFLRRHAVRSGFIPRSTRL